jgi:hypothetical protein
MPSFNVLASFNAAAHAQNDSTSGSVQFDKSFKQLFQFYSLQTVIFVSLYDCATHF